MTVTYITPDAELDDLIIRTESGTAKIKKLLTEETDTPPSQSPRTIPDWLSFAVVAAIAGTFGVVAGVMLF